MVYTQSGDEHVTTNINVLANCWIEVIKHIGYLDFITFRIEQWCQ